MVRVAGLEPARPKAGDFKSPVYYQFHHTRIILKRTIDTPACRKHSLDDPTLPLLLRFNMARPRGIEPRSAPSERAILSVEL